MAKAEPRTYYLKHEDGTERLVVADTPAEAIKYVSLAWKAKVASGKETGELMMRGIAMEYAKPQKDSGSDDAVQVDVVTVIDGPGPADGWLEHVPTRSELDMPAEELDIKF